MTSDQRLELEAAWNDAVAAAHAGGPPTFEVIDALVAAGDALVVVLAALPAAPPPDLVALVREMGTADRVWRKEKTVAAHSALQVAIADVLASPLAALPAEPSDGR